MKKQSLNGAWTLTVPGSVFPDTPANVPGSVDGYGGLMMCLEYV